MCAGTSDVEHRWVKLASVMLAVIALQTFVPSVAGETAVRQLSSS